MNDAAANKGGLALVALATAQFLHGAGSVRDERLDQRARTAGFHTTVTTIQPVITMYGLVMAMLILTGANVADMSAADGRSSSD